MYAALLGSLVYPLLDKGQLFLKRRLEPSLIVNIQRAFE